MGEPTSDDLMKNLTEMRKKQKFRLRASSFQADSVSEYKSGKTNASTSSLFSSNSSSSSSSSLSKLGGDIKCIGNTAFSLLCWMNSQVLFLSCIPAYLHTTTLCANLPLLSERAWVEGTIEKVQVCLRWRRLTGQETLLLDHNQHPVKKVWNDCHACLPQDLWSFWSRWVCCLKGSLSSSIHISTVVMLISRDWL